MKGRLFWKIWLGFWATSLLLSYGLWLYWSVAPAADFQEWDTPLAVGRVLTASATTALEHGGAAALARQMADWPQEERARLTLQSEALNCSPSNNRQIAIMVETASNRYCLRYATPPLPEEATNFLAMPPDDLVAAALAGLVFSAALAWYLAYPIHQLRQGFSRLADGDFTVRLNDAMGRRRDEIPDLANDFDRMAGRLAELVEARDRLLHDVSHELRSPLARMRLAIGLLRRDPARFEISVQRIDCEADHIDKIVGELLTLARLESGVDHEGEYFDLLDVLELVLDDVMFEAEAQNVKIDADLPREPAEHDWLIAGSGLLIRRATENILRNALRFSSPNQAIRVTLTAQGEGCLLTVEDDGPGVRTSEPNSLLQPFVRDTPYDNSGYGLGLAIARRAVVACGGDLHLSNRTPTGLCVKISLPLANLNGLGKFHPVLQ